jgi:hypothetical protein
MHGEIAHHTCEVFKPKTRMEQLQMTCKKVHIEGSGGIRRYPVAMCDRVGGAARYVPVPARIVSFTPAVRYEPELG